MVGSWGLLIAGWELGFTKEMIATEKITSRLQRLGWKVWWREGWEGLHWEDCVWKSCLGFIILPLFPCLYLLAYYHFASAILTMPYGQMLSSFWHITFAMMSPSSHLSHFSFLSISPILPSPSLSPTLPELSWSWSSLFLPEWKEPATSRSKAVHQVSHCTRLDTSHYQYLWVHDFMLWI